MYASEKNKNTKNEIDATDEEITLIKKKQELQKEKEALEVQEANKQLEDLAYVCEQKHGRKYLCPCPIKFALLTIWSALCIIFSLLCIYRLWDTSLFDLIGLYSSPVPDWGISTFKLWGYVFFSGVAGGAVYTICAIYSHIVSPRGNAFTGSEDQSDIQEAKTIKQSSSNIYSEEELQDGRKIRKEQRRFCATSRAYWIFRPLLGGVGGIFACIIIFSTFLSAFLKSSDGTTAVPNTEAYIGVAFIAGLSFGDFVRFCSKKFGELFTTASKADTKAKDNTDTKPDEQEAKVNTTLLDINIKQNDSSNKSK